MLPRAGRPPPVLPATRLERLTDDTFVQVRSSLPERGDPFDVAKLIDFPIRRKHKMDNVLLILDRVGICWDKTFSTGAGGGFSIPIVKPTAIWQPEWNE